MPAPSLSSAPPARQHSIAAFFSPAIEISAEKLGRIKELYDRGLMLQAYQEARPLGPLHQWDGKARTLAARLTGNLGAPRLAGVLHWRAWRAHKHNHDAAAYYAHVLLGHRGPLAAWEFLRAHGEPAADSEAEGLMHLYSVQAAVSAHLRDFASAETSFARALAIAPENPWVATTRATLDECQDRYPEALEAGRHALALRPWYRPAVQTVAHLLQLLDREEEALAFLKEASRQIENLYVVHQLATLQMELGQYAGAAASLARFEELGPMMESRERKGLLQQQVSLACLQNDNATALSLAKKIDEPYHRELAERLEQPVENRRVRLDVPFIRQHHMTCAPATLAAISRYWQEPAEHLEVAEAICYDGTPAHSERNWAETNGWVAREFTVTWDAARALLDRGIPFTLTTSEATSAHLQAVVGYDVVRETLWIRDPFIYCTGEFRVKPLLERYQATGPRGMMLVPANRSELLEGVELPDAELYDRLHQVQSALAGHHREEALETLAAMQAAAPDHRLTLTARRALASYDGNTPALLEALEALSKQFPEDGHLNLARLNCLRELARRGERLELLETLCARPGVDPIFWQQYAQELRSDSRQHAACVSWVRWALRHRPADADLLSAWADLLWDQRSFATAAPYYRLAACLGEKREHFSRNFFIASRHLRETESALDFLRRRNEQFGAKSCDPALTLIESLQHLGRTPEAFDVLEAALIRRSGDGGLRLFAADFYGRFFHFDKAVQWLEAARGLSPPVVWRRTAAALADYRNDKPVALEHWREALKLEPLSHDATRAITLLLAETESREAALRFLDERCALFPFSCPLLALRIEWLKEVGADAAVPALRQYLEVNPANAWAWRELALQLSNSGRKQEALEAADEAIRLEAHSSHGYGVRADLLLQSDRGVEARRDFLQAVRLEVDNSFALFHYVATAPTLAERRQALVEVAEELRRQVIFADALSVYQDAARGLLTPEEVLQLLQEAHAARPDLWQAWSVLVNQLTDIGRHDEALKVAREATERFPLLPKLWVDLSRVHQARLDAAGETAALEKALEINPAYTLAARQLAAIHERHHEWARARAVLEQAIASNPLEVQNHGCLAQVLWKSGEREPALERVQHALKLQPGYDWGWNALRDWGGQLDRPAIAADMARELSRSRAGESRSWLLLAKSLSPHSDTQELFHALERAIELNPRCEDAHDCRAYTLTLLNRFDDALVHCVPAALQPTPARLKIRAAWIEAQRGNIAQAIARARAAIDEHPDYYWGWQLLSEWHVQSNDAGQAVHAAEKMVALAPLEPVPLGYLGDLKLRLGDQEGAKAVFQRAFALDPDYEYAGFHLFGLQLARHEFAFADETLHRLSRRGENFRTRASAVELAIAQKSEARALEFFKTLCADPEVEFWALANATRALDNDGLGRKVNHILEKRLSDNPPPALAEFWVVRQADKGRWALHGKLAALKEQGEAGRRAVLCYLDQLGRAYQAAVERQDITRPWQLRRHFRALLKRHGAWLKEDVDGWGKVGFVLATIGKPDPAIEWLQDWKNHPAAESWMLYNLAIMLQRKKRYDESTEIIRHAVTLRHGDDLYETFHLWAAFEDALRGCDASAERLLSSLPSDSVAAFRRPLPAMTQLLIELRRTTTEGHGDFARKLRTTLRESFGKARPCEADDYTHGAYLRFMDVASRELGGTGLWLWGKWFYRRGKWFTTGAIILGAPFVLMVPPLIIPYAVMLLVRHLNRRVS